MGKSKVIFLDFGIFMHRAIFAWRNNKQMPPEYTCLNMMLSSLRRIGIEPQDEIIIACDKGRSWRRDVEKQYKANRKAFRDSYQDIDWKEMYRKFDELLDKINEGTDWHIVKAQNLEADDWMAVGCRYYKDAEVILVTYDADMEQLCVYDNVKVFSPIIKHKGGKGAYKVIKNPYKVLAKKIKKETADNLTNPILNAEDFEKRKMIVSLLELPEFVEIPIRERFEEIDANIKSEGDLEAIPFRTIREKIGNLYNDRNKIVSYQQCVEKAEKKKRKKRKRKK